MMSQLEKFQEPQTRTAGFQTIHDFLVSSEKMKNRIFSIMNKKNMDNNNLANWIVEKVKTSKNEEEILNVLINKIQNLEEEKVGYKKKAYLCTLTNALNRNFFQEFSNSYEEKRTMKFQTTKTFFFYLDLNKFKNINDTLGHKVGDEVLIEFSHRLSNIVRGEDLELNFDMDAAIDNNFFVRLGGDEFILKVELQHEGDALLVQERIKQSMSNPIITTKGPLNIGVSIGYQQLNENNTIEEIINEADKKMYEEKRKWI